MSDVDLHGAAAMLHRSYHRFQKAWRGLPGFPPPFIGSAKGQRPFWRRDDIEAWKAGARWPLTPSEGVATPGHLAQREAAEPAPNAPSNDLRPPPMHPADRAAHLLAAAGGRR